MSVLPQYDPTATRSLLRAEALEALVPTVERARAAVLADVDLWTSKSALPQEKIPLDAGFIELPTYLLEDRPPHGIAGWPSGLLANIEHSAAEFRNQVDRMVVLGIGGSYMGLRAIFEALCPIAHNERSRQDRNSVPRLSFEGDNLDNDAVQGLLSLINQQSRNKSDVLQRWGIVVISKSGGTLETAVAFRLFREALESYYGPESPEARSLVIPITGETGKLRDFSKTRRYSSTFPIPDGVGGRFSVLTAVGLYPAAVLGLNIREMLRGARDMTDQFRAAPLDKNTVLNFVAVSHLAERDLGCHIRILSTWGKRLEALGLWYDQLLAESLGKHECGATPLTVVNTRDLHSRGQQHQEGVRNKLITNLIVDSPLQTPRSLPQAPADLNQDDLNRHAGKTLPRFLSAAIQGTNQAYAEARRPTADLRIPRLDEYQLGALFQMFMLATAVEGRLLGINPYGQPGVESYKRNMNDILNRQ